MPLPAEEKLEPADDLAVEEAELPDDEDADLDDDAEVEIEVEVDPDDGKILA
jgi:DNA-directed RNA polymerase alpha subunit